MPITTEIRPKLSINTGPGNSTAQGNPNDSIGGFMSSTEIAQATLGNLFDDISGDENALGTVDFRAIFFHNSHASLALTAARVWISGPRCDATAADNLFTLNDAPLVAHGFTDGMAVRVEAEKPGDAMPGGINNGTTFFIRDATATTFRLAAAAGGAAIDITTAGKVAVRQFAGAVEEIALDGTGVVSATSAAAQAERIANETTAPAGEVFSAPVTKAAGLAIASLGAAQAIAVWIRRTAQNSGALNLDRVFIRIEGDSAE